VRERERERERESKYSILDYLFRLLARWIEVVVWGRGGKKEVAGGEGGGGEKENPGFAIFF